MKKQVKKEPKKQAPKKIKIGYKYYDVIYTDSLSSFINIYEPGVQGRIFYTDSQIFILNHKDERNTKNTLLHEIIHAILNMEAIEMEERDVINLANGIHTFLKENQKTVEYIIND